jgi:hypothetical protein
MSDLRELVRAIVEECWSDEAGLERMGGLVTAGYLRWRGTRRDDGSAVDGRGAYHCRIEDGRVAEDWDVFFPAG